MFEFAGKLSKYPEKPGETYDEWSDRVTRAEKADEIRKREINKKKAKARAKRKRTGR